MTSGQSLAHCIDYKVLSRLAQLLSASYRCGRLEFDSRVDQIGTVSPMARRFFPAVLPRH